MVAPAVSASAIITFHHTASDGEKVYRFTESVLSLTRRSQVAS
jgi:hypothetical protein